MSQRILNVVALALVAVVAVGIGGMMTWRALNPPPPAPISKGIEVKFGPPPEAPPGVMAPRPLSASPGVERKSRTTKEENTDKANTDESK